MGRTLWCRRESKVTALIIVMAIIFMMVITYTTGVTTALLRLLARSSKILQRNKATAYFLTKYLSKILLTNVLLLTAVTVLTKPFVRQLSTLETQRFALLHWRRNWLCPVGCFHQKFLPIRSAASHYSCCSVDWRASGDTRTCVFESWILSFGVEWRAARSTVVRFDVSKD